MRVDITVIQKPVKVVLDCLRCGEEIESDYDSFRNKFGDPCDWMYSKLICPHCNSEIEIHNTEWD